MRRSSASVTVGGALWRTFSYTLSVGSNVSCSWA